MRKVTGTVIAALACVFFASTGWAQEDAAVNWRLTSDEEPTAVTGNLVGTALMGSNMTVYGYGGTSGKDDGAEYEGPYGTYQRWQVGEGENWPDESMRDAEDYTLENIFAKEVAERYSTDWMPEEIDTAQEEPGSRSMSTHPAACTSTRCARATSCRPERC